jgi:hypothetical protein
MALALKTRRLVSLAFDYNAMDLPHYDNITYHSKS